MAATFPEQLRRYSVALISLAVALSGLAYNTWRNERSEENKNTRTAGIEVLLLLGDLDQVVFHAHYDKDTVAGNPRTGWAMVLTIRDLGGLTMEPAISATRELVQVWDANWAGLGHDDVQAQNIADAIERVRGDVLTVISKLD
ncbi:MAG: hypothetical protein BMS9Abin32_546 [Gammaproteobacteria bacterium]|nr:MAG: hypothetical protein BMS9Abin32_546 [Gammaproteobacteria bacterium]